MLRWLTAGESHGMALTGIIEGMPSGLRVSAGEIDIQLQRRQGGYGRGDRMKIEHDRARITAGIRHGLTTGAPVAVMVENRDWVNWEQVMSPDEPASTTGEQGRRFTCPRPGHADLAGALKYGHQDLRDVLERSSARSTAIIVALGTIARLLLVTTGVEIAGRVSAIGEVHAGPGSPIWDNREAIERSPVRCDDLEVESAMIAEIDAAATAGDTLGGIIEIRARGLCPGLGSHVHPDRRLDAAIAEAMMSIPAIKGVEIGAGFSAVSQRGSCVHDPIYYDAAAGGYRHTSNNAGGIEGGMSNGEEIVVRIAMKPIPTMRKPLESVDMTNRAKCPAHSERSDTCAVPAAAVVAEAELSLVLARALLEKFGGDTLDDLLGAYNAYMRRIAER